MFQDRARIVARAGRGGDGALSFRREKHVPRGGPDGGDGGSGGDVVLLADPDLRDLGAFRSRKQYAAGRGGSGGGSGKHGADGDDVILHVPVGTQVLDAEGNLTADLAHPGARVVVAEGGSRRPRQPPLRVRHAPGAAVRGDRASGRRDGARAPPEAARRRGSGRPAERRQVVAAPADLECAAEGGGLPVHDPRAGARDGRRARRTPARRRRRSRSDRGRRRGSGPRP